MKVGIDISLHSTVPAKNGKIIRLFTLKKKEESEVAPRFENKILDFGIGRSNGVELSGNP